MIRRLVLSIFIFSFIFESQDLWAKKKTSNKKNDVVYVTHNADIINKKVTKKSRLKNEESSVKKIKKINKIKKIKKVKKAKKLKKITAKKKIKNKKPNIINTKRKTNIVRKKNTKKSRLKNEESSVKKIKKIEKVKNNKKTKRTNKTKKVDKRINRDTWRVNKVRAENKANLQRKLRTEKLIALRNMRIKGRARAIKQWKAINKADIAQDYADGFYADLYKRPEWPFSMLYADNTNLLQIKTTLEHATNWYNSTGSSQDLSAGTFSEQDFTFRDISLALDLRERTVGATSVLTDIAGGNFPWAHFIGDDGDDINGLYDNKLIFFGSENRLDVNLNYGRYIKDKDIFIGFEIPVGYKQNRLKFDTDVLPGNDVVGHNNVDFVYLRTFQREVFDYLLHAKGLKYNEKNSITGIGDISTLINFNINTKYAERFECGGKIVWPTAKQADTSKLFAPELGYGFTQFKVFSSVMFNKQYKYFNPHMFAEFTYVWEGHKNKRVPKIITYDGAHNNDEVGNATMALGDKVRYTNIAFTEPDTRVVAFADNVKSVKIRPGAEFNLRLGNIWEKIIWRRSFLDVYYDFRGKIKDKVLHAGLSESEWQLKRLEENTIQIEHKAGFDLSYQFDIHSRVNMGAKYTFAGINVSDTIKAHCGLEIEF